MIDIWKAREVQGSTDNLQRELNVSQGLDPQSRGMAQNLVSRLRHVNARTPDSAKDALRGEVDSFYSRLAGQAPTGGTMGTMNPEAIRREAAGLEQELATAPARRQHEIVQRLSQLEAARAQGSSRVEIDLYAARHARDDLNTWFAGIKNPTEQQRNDFRAVQDRGTGLIAEAEKRFRERSIDVSGAVLAQAQVSREQVEREMLGAVQARYKDISPADFNRYTATWQKWTRGVTRLTGATVGAISGVGLSSTVGTAIGVGGIVAASPALAGTALVGGSMVLGGIAGAALTRYVPWLMPFGPLSRRATRSAEAQLRIRKMLNRGSELSELEQVLVNRVAHDTERVQEMSAKLQEEYGGVFTRVRRGIGKSVGYGLAGTGVAAAIGTGMTIYQNPALVTQWPPTMAAGEALVKGSVSNLTGIFNSYISPAALWLLKPATRLIRWRLTKT